MYSCLWGFLPPVYLRTKSSGVSWTGTLSGEVPHLFRLLIVGHLNLVTKQGMDSSEHLWWGSLLCQEAAESCSSKIKQCSNSLQVLDYQQALKCPACLYSTASQWHPGDLLLPRQVSIPRENDPKIIQCPLYIPNWHFRKSCSLEKWL